MKWFVNHQKLLAIILILSNWYFWFPHLSFSVQQPALSIVFLNIGQGDAILLRSPDGYLGLIDAGPGTNVLQELGEVLPYYQRRFEFVLMTHPDADHIEGYREVLRRYEVKMLFWQKVNKKTALYEDIRQLVAESGIINYQLNEANDFRLGCCVYIDVLSPSANEDIYNYEDTNQASTALLISYAGKKIFTAGDLGVYGEERVAPLAGKIDILKAGHHGSNTSSSENFLALTRPDYMIFSAGKGNIYGHPSPQVLARAEHLGAQVWRTDQDGRISIDISAAGIQINPN